MWKNALYLSFVFALWLLPMSGGAQDNSTPQKVSNARAYLYTHPDSTRYLLNQVLASKSETFQEFLPEIYWLTGEVYRVQSRFDSALFYFNKGAEQAARQGQQRQQALSELGQGNTLLSLGKMSQAQEKFNKSLTYFDRYELKDEAAAVYTSMGFLFQRSRDLKKARVFYDEALKRQLGSNNHLQVNLATWHGRMNQPDSALMIYDRLLADSTIQNDLLVLSRVYLNGAIIYDQIGDHEKVVAYSRKSLNYNERLGNLKSMGVTYQNLTQYHFLRGDFDRSKECLDSGYFYARKVGDLNVFIKLLGIEVEFEKRNKNYKQAELLMERYDMLKDSLQNQRQESLVQELNIKYEAVASKQKIAELELEQKNAALSLSRSRNQRNLFISGFVILIIIAGFLFYQYRTKKRISDILADKNHEISEALFDREILLKEIHHRVKNNLQIISSLLYLQAGSLEDEAAIDAVRQGEHRVKAMGLIHERLYSTEDVRGVDIQDYFEKLFDELLTAFGDDETDIEYVVKTNGLKLDIDTVIPLGLIINELITNAVKYAFREQAEGLIEVIVKEEGEKLHVRIKDNGVGMDGIDLQKVNSFGWKMMHSLSRKLKAEISVANLSGTVVEITVARYKLVK